MNETININEFCKYFDLSVYTIYKRLLISSNKYGIKLMHQFENGEIYTSKEYFDKIIKHYEFLKCLVPDKKHIISNSTSMIPFANGSYVYFLIDNIDLVYIGQTINMGNRLNEHLKDKKFNKVYYFKVDEDDRLIVELLCIEQYRPIYNTAGMDNILILNSILKIIKNW